MHNFAQRRSFMMGGFDRSNEFQHPHIQQKSQQQEVESNRVYRVENNDDDPDEKGDGNTNKKRKTNSAELYDKVD